MAGTYVDCEKVAKQDFGNVVVQRLIDSDALENISITKVQLKGEQKFGLSKKSDSFYYVLAGEGKFFVEDQVFTVKKGDLVHIPKNTKYKDEGDLILLAIVTPRFDLNEHAYFDE